MVLNVNRFGGGGRDGSEWRRSREMGYMIALDVLQVLLEHECLRYDQRHLRPAVSRLLLRSRDPG